MTDGVDVQKLLNRLIVLTAALVLFVALLGAGAAVWGVYERGELRRQAGELERQAVVIDEQAVVARRTLCVEIEALKALERRRLEASIAEAERFLDEHPRGIPGIRPELINRGLERNRRDLGDLAPIDCENFARGDDDLYRGPR